jgi:putative beta-lysine N-acetyltransferase
VLLPELKHLKFPSGFADIYQDPYSNRIRIDNYGGSVEHVLDEIRNFIPAWTEKIIFKSRSCDRKYFESENYVMEARIPGYFSGEEMYFLVCYLKPERAQGTVVFQGVPFTDFAMEAKLNQTIASDNVTSLLSSDADAIAEIFGQVFQYYPTPMHQPAYVKETMEQGTIYFGIKHSGKLVSVASAEVNYKFSNAELTDCASLPECAGRGYMQDILQTVQTELLNRNIFCHYTLARAGQPGINKVFFKLGFDYCGILKQNCRIGTGLEDMSVWVKNYPKPL